MDEVDALTRDADEPFRALAEAVGADDDAT